MTSDERYPLPRALARLPRDQGRLSKEFLAQDQRDRIVQAALEVFGSKGLAAATVQDLVREAGVSRETFYRYFADKDDCLRVLHDELLTWLEEEARAAAVASEGWAASVLAVCRRLVGFLAGDPRVARIVAVEYIAAGPEVLARQEKASARAAGALRAGREATGGELPDVLEPILIAGALSLVGRRIASGREGSAEPFAAEVCALILIFYLGPEEARAALGAST